jgi:hypothetical protein
MAHYPRKAAGAIAGAVLAALAAGQGRAQTPETRSPVLTSPYEVSACLCLERDIAARLQDMSARRAAYEALTSRMNDLQADLDRRRKVINVNDPAQVDDFRRRLDELDALQAEQTGSTLPAYQAAVAAYNQRVAQFTERCAGRALDQNVVNQLRANLVCQLN